MFHQIGLTFTYLLLVAVACAALQNIRIQVNNENLRNPPYLLEALKQASAQESGYQAQSQTNSNFASDQSTTGLDDRLSQQRNPAEAKQDLGVRGKEEASGESNKDEKVSVIKGETIEELLDLEPESVLRLSPEAIIGSVALQESSNYAPHSAERIEHHSEQHQGPTNHETRKPQLPVSSSHLKRPALSVEQLDKPLHPSVNKLVTSEDRPNLSEAPIAGGAKSRVSPTVESDDGPAEKSGKNKAASVQPPDTWDASQVMHGVTNASLIPATVRRQYGHQTRTRITLGGGYEREKLPPSVDPISGYQDNGPEKQLVPLERLSSHHEDQDQAESSNVDSANDYDRNGAVENSRLVEVPKRIVLPVSAFIQDEAPSKPRPVNATRRRDSRCPANGLTSLEHPTACDKYYLCQDGQISEHTCPNGLMYGTRGVVRDYCIHRWEADCGDKSIPNPISSPGCRWQNGIFTVQGSPKCVPDFYECKDGIFEVHKCTVGGQVYDDKTKSCRYAEQVGCTQEALGDFSCPADDQTNTYWPFPRYFLNERALIHCINDKAQIIRCRDHERVDPEHLFCVPINKSGAPAGDESAGTPEITERRSTSSNKQREKTSKPADSQPASVVAAN